MNTKKMYAMNVSSIHQFCEKCTKKAVVQINVNDVKNIKNAELARAVAD